MADAAGSDLIHARDRKPILAYPAENAAERLDTSIYKSCPGAPDAGTKAKFQTHGLYLLAGANNVHRLFVVLHGGRESVEVFDVDARKGTPIVTGVGCVVAPEPIGLDSVRGLADGGFIATNFLARAAGGGGLGGPGMKAMMSGEKNGELWEWHPATSWQKLSGTETAGANRPRDLAGRQDHLRGGMGHAVVLPRLPRRDDARAQRDSPRLPCRQHPVVT